MVTPGSMRKDCLFVLPVLMLSLTSVFTPGSAHRSSPTPLSTAPPLLDRHPFMVTWNIPDLVCNRPNIFLDTSPFHGVSNPAKVLGQFLVLFYPDRLGLYPHVSPDSGRHLNGGIPQRGNMQASLEKARQDILHYIPSESSPGLAIIDWEDWRPLWERTWGSKQIYQTLSVSYTQVRHPSLTARQALALAKRQFESAARCYMLESVVLGTRLRPQYLWGFYLFPNCYNYGWEWLAYTRRCTREVWRQNEMLLWLWQVSTVLFPSIYLQASQGDRRSAALMVRNRVREALRVAALPNQTHTAPEHVFNDQSKRLLIQGDLVSTLGESAVMGASGTVLWGASTDYDNKASCKAFSTHLDRTINPYVTNVTAAVCLCSVFLCQGRGRCIRRDQNLDQYLHLSAASFRIRRDRAGRYQALGRPSLSDLQALTSAFTCRCYSGLPCEPETLVLKNLLPPSTKTTPQTTTRNPTPTEELIQNTPASQETATKHD